MTRRTLFRSVLGAFAGAQATRAASPAPAQPVYPTLEDNPGQNVEIHGEVFINGKHLAEVIAREVAKVAWHHGIKPL